MEQSCHTKPKNTQNRHVTQFTALTIVFGAPLLSGWSRYAAGLGTKGQPSQMGSVVRDANRRRSGSRVVLSSKRSGKSLHFVRVVHSGALRKIEPDIQANAPGAKTQ